MTSLAMQGGKQTAFFPTGVRGVVAPNSDAIFGLWFPVPLFEFGSETYRVYE